MDRQMLEYWHKFSAGWGSHFNSGTKRKRSASSSDSVRQSDLNSATSSSAEAVHLGTSGSGLRKGSGTPTTSLLPSETPIGAHWLADTGTQTSFHSALSTHKEKSPRTFEQNQSSQSVRLSRQAQSPSIDVSSGVFNARHNNNQIPALLLTDSLLGQLSQFVEASREVALLARTYRDVAKNAGAGEAFLECQRSQIEEEKDDAERDRLIQFMENREPSITADVERRQKLGKILDNKKKELSWYQDDLRCALEPPLLDVGLLEPPPPESNFEWAAEQSGQDIVTDDAEPVGASPAHEEALSDEELERRMALEELDNAADNLNALRERFTGVAAEERQAMWNYNELAAAGNVTFPVEEMHLYLLKQSMDLTRALIEAEERCEQAEAHARALRVLGNTFDQQSHFLDYDDDDEISSFHGSENGERARNAFIEEWRSNVPESSPEAETPEVDDWDYQSIQIGDSLSDVDYTRNRRRIDRWRFICESCGHEGDSGAMGQEMIKNGQ